VTAFLSGQFPLLARQYLCLIAEMQLQQVQHVGSELMQQLLKSAINVDSVCIANFKNPKFLNGIHGSRAFNQMRTNNARI
jgi:hypothetical protein